MDHLPATPRDQWRRVQLARYLIDYRGVRVEQMKFNELGQVQDYGIPEAELADTADLMIAIGGDGAMLYAGQLARRGDVPLLGINRGRLGFLADVTPEEMLDSVGHVLAGEFTTDKRLVLEARLERQLHGRERATRADAPTA